MKEKGRNGRDEEGTMRIGRRKEGRREMERAREGLEGEKGERER